jgi:membrane complex biogenesis BtpA family protein
MKVAAGDGIAAAVRGTMCTAWLEELFGVKKPIIALLHLQALPGDPAYGGDLAFVVRRARDDLCALQEGGVDGVLFANEFSMPFQLPVDAITVGAMGYIVGALRSETKTPFGINVCLNPLASLDLAAATGAAFIRSTFTGAYTGELGLYSHDAAAIMRRRKYLGAGDVRLLFKVNPEGDSWLVDRDIQGVTRSIIAQCTPDALCVSGSSAGSETSTDLLTAVKSAAGQIPVFCNTGFTLQTAGEKLSIADAACVGTAFKTSGGMEGTVDVERVAAIMDAVKAIRLGLADK